MMVDLLLFLLIRIDAVDDGGGDAEEGNNSNLSKQAVCHPECYHKV